MLQNIFDELAQRYATDEGNGYTMRARIFTRQVDLEEYATSFDYAAKPLCYAIGW